MARKTLEERIADAAERKRQAVAREQELLAKKREGERKAEFRRTLIVGRIVREQMPQDALKELLDRHLTRDDERALFGLPSKA